LPINTTGNNTTPINFHLQLSHHVVFTTIATTKTETGQRGHRTSSQQPYTAINKKINSATIHQQRQLVPAVPAGS
jgi:hypothetical protein